MNKNKILALALVGMIIKPITVFVKKSMLESDNLPRKAKTFIRNNFPCQGISYVEKKDSSQGSVYEVCLNDGTMISFDKKGAWNKVDYKVGPLPITLMSNAAGSLHFFGKDVMTFNKKTRRFETLYTNSI